MNAETAAAALEFLATDTEPSTSANDHVTLTFFGGEPLLEFPLLRQIVEDAETRFPGRFSFRLSTNGILLTREMLEFFAEHKMYFTLSLDGHRDQHDASRRTNGGKGSYDKIVSRVEDILHFNPYTMAVSVVRPVTAGMIAEGVQSLFAMGFRYVLQTLDYSADWRDEQIRVLKRQYTTLASFYKKALLDGRKLSYSPFDERIRTWAQKPHGPGSLCDIGNTQIAVAPSGRIYPCVQFIGNDQSPDHEFCIGDVLSGFHDTLRRQYINNNYSSRPQCDGCALDGRCANYCGCVNWKATGSVTQIPPIICEHERMLMPIVDKMANDLWKRNSSIFRRKFYDPSFPVSSFIEDCMR